MTFKERTILYWMTFTFILSKIIFVFGFIASIAVPFYAFLNYDKNLIYISAICIICTMCASYLDKNIMQNIIYELDDGRLSSINEEKKKQIKLDRFGKS